MHRRCVHPSCTISRERLGVPKPQWATRLDETTSRGICCWLG